MKTFEEICKLHQTIADNGALIIEREDIFRAFKQVHDQAVDLCLKHIVCDGFLTGDFKLWERAQEESVQKVKDMLK